LDLFDIVGVIKLPLILDVPLMVSNCIKSIKEKFKDINRQNLETKYTLNLGLLLKIALNLKRYMWQKMKPMKATIFSKPIKKGFPF
jgi:hypothetical protein